jgi:hypothetical protein
MRSQLFAAAAGVMLLAAPAAKAQESGGGVMIMRLRIFAATAGGLMLLFAGSASATQTYCAIVKPAADGFLALRSGPHTRFPIIARLRPFEFLWMDTGQCRNGLCDETGRWQFVEGKKQGWVNSKFIQQITCPDEG